MKGSRNRDTELDPQRNRTVVRLLPTRGQLWTIQFNHPCDGNVDITRIATVNGIRMLRNGLMGMYFGTVMVPVTAMLMRSRQVRMWRRPLNRQEDGQQNQISRGAKALPDQKDGRFVKSSVDFIVS